MHKNQVLIFPQFIYEYEFCEKANRLDRFDMQGLKWAKPLFTQWEGEKR